MSGTILDCIKKGGTNDEVKECVMATSQTNPSSPTGKNINAMVAYASAVAGQAMAERQQPYGGDVAQRIAMQQKVRAENIARSIPNFVVPK